MANWIQSRREVLNLTQDELATRLQVTGFNVTRATVSHWEKSRYNPPLDNPRFVDAIAIALEVSATEVLLMAGYNINTNMSTAARTAADIIDQMPEERRETAIKILEQLRAGK